MEGSWLLLWLLVLSLLVFPAKKLGPVQRRRLRRWALFVLGALLGGIGAVGLVALAVFALWGAAPLQVVADRAAGEWAQGRQAVMSALNSAPLPNIVRPTTRSPEPAPQQVLHGYATHVRDGDTIEVAGVPVRFENVDCAERNTPGGDEATAALRNVVRGQFLRCRLIGRRSYDREIGTCRMDDGRDPGMVLVAMGLCRSR